MARERLLTDQTGKEIAKAIEAIAIAGSGAAEALDAACEAMIDGYNTGRVFDAWLPRAMFLEGKDADRYELLCRFAGFVADAWKGKTYTLRSYTAESSSLPTMTPLDDLADMSAGQLVTETTRPETDWTDDDPIGGWYVRANALSLADGTMQILAFEGEDDFDLTGETAPVYTFSLALWLKEWTEGEYDYISFRTTEAEGFYPDAGDVGLNNKKRAVTWHPTFPGGLNSSGGLTSGAGLKPLLFTSAIAALPLARRVSEYEGLWNDCDTRWLLRMWQLRHFNLENSGIAEGCTSYNVDYTPAVAETNVERVILTTAQAANLIVGSTVSLTPSARGSSGAFTLCKITSIEEVTISGTTYAAVNVDNGGTKFSPTTSMHLCSMPWHSGATEALPGHKDGCVHSLTAGKGPLRVMGVEVLDGAYALGLDPLYNVMAGSEEGKFNYAIYEQRNSENLSDGVSGYSNTGLAYENMPSGWQYVKAFLKTRLGVLFPRLIGGSSTTYFKSAFSGTGSAGVRAPWRFTALSGGGYAGLAGEHGHYSPASSYWAGRPRLCGSGKKRGEWPT